MIRPWTRAIILLAALAGTNALSEEDSAISATCTVLGQVVGADDGVAIRNAHVVLSTIGMPERIYSAASDAEGKFRISGIEPGRYILSAHKNGYLVHRYGQKSPRDGFGPLDLRAGRVTDGVVLRLTAASVISGRILDGDGEPVAGADVRALAERQRNRYEAIFEPGTNYLTVAEVQTNDLGAFRLYGLLPGKYLVRADSESVASTPANPHFELSSAPTFYPGTTDPSEATLIVLGVGQEQQIEMQMRPEGTSANIRGKVIPPAGRSVEGLALWLDSSTPELRRTRIPSLNHEGNFEITGVASGVYILQGSTEYRGTRYFAKLPVTVGDRDAEDLRLVFSPSKKLSGRIVFQGGNLLANQTSELVVSARNRVGDAGKTVRVGADGTFSLELTNDTYSVQVRGVPEGFYARSIHYGVQDVLQNGLALYFGTPAAVLEIVLSASAARLKGTVTDKQGAPVSAQLLLVPDQPNFLKVNAFQRGVTDNGGKFSFAGIAPGAYKLVVIEADEEKLAVDVTAAEGESKRLDLKVESTSTSTTGGR